MPEAQEVDPSDDLPIVEDERRARVRYPSHQRTLCQTDTAQPDDIWMMGRIRELSETGLSLHIGRRFDRGDVVSIEPIQGMTDSARVIQARVIHVRQDRKGGWVLGCQFTQPLSADELKTLL
jgi:hypothetical protein